MVLMQVRSRSARSWSVIPPPPRLRASGALGWVSGPGERLHGRDASRTGCASRPPPHLAPRLRGPPGSSGAQDASLLLDRCEEPLEGVGELLDAVRKELRGGLVDRDAEVGELL